VEIKAILGRGRKKTYWPNDKEKLVIQADGAKKKLGTVFVRGAVTTYQRGEGKGQIRLVNGGGD